MAPSSDSCVVQPHPQHCGLPAALGPSVSHPTGGIHLGHTEQAFMLVGQEDAVTDCLKGQSSLEGELPVCCPAPTLSQAIDVPWPNR